MKQTKTFLKRALTVLLVLMTLMSTVSIGITSASAAVAPDEYTETIDLSGDKSDATADEAPSKAEDKTTTESKGEADTQSAPQRPDKEIANVGANVDIAGTDYNNTGGYVYFYKPSGWGSYAYLVVGHDTYSTVYRFSQLSGYLYYVSPGSFNGATYTAVLADSSSWGSGEWGPSNLSNAPKSKNYGGYTLNSGSTYFATSSSISYKSAGYSALNYAQKGYVSTSLGGGAFSTDNTQGGTVAIKSYALTGNGKGSTATSAAGSSASRSAAHGTAVTYIATANTGYTFNGWYTAEDGGTRKSTSASYQFADSTGTHTYYAQFSQKSYTVTFKNWDGSTITTQTVYHGNSATAPANPTRPSADGLRYTFSGWDKSLSNITADTTITAEYTSGPDTVTVTFVDDAAVGGGQLKTQTIEFGASATAPTVSPKNGWEFYAWDKDFSNVTSNITVTAIRSNKNVQLVGDVVGSWATGTGQRMSYNANGTNSKTVTLPKGSYEFKFYVEEFPKYGGRDGSSAVNDECYDWQSSDSGGNITINTSGGKYTFTFNRNNWRYSVSYTPVTYNVTLSSSPSGAGTQSATKTTVNLGDTTTLTASAKKGYTFSKWELSGGYAITSGSTSSSSVTISVTGAVTAKAVYVGNSGTVIYKAGAGGTVTKSGSNSVTYPSGVSSTASPIDGYSFKNWTITGGEEGTNYTISSGSLTDPSITIKVYTKNREITATANFVTNTNTFKFVAGSNGSVTNSGSHEVTYPATASTTASGSKGYHFTHWEVSGGTEGTDFRYTSGSSKTASIEVQPVSPGNVITFTAVFAGNVSNINYTAGTGGTVTNAGGAVTHPNSSTSTANPSTGYYFKNWSITGGTEGTDYSITSGSTNDATISVQPITAGKTITVTANFAEQYKIVASRNYSSLGTVSSSTNYVTPGGTVTISADADSGNGFDKWSITGSYTITSGSLDSETITIKPTSDITAEAVFLAGITMSAGEGGSVSPAPGKHLYDYNESVSIKATANNGYRFKEWVIEGTYSGSPSTTSASTSLNVRDSVTATAVFVKTYVVTFVNYDGTTLKTQTVDTGTAATAPSNPTRPGGWEFDHWDTDFSNVTSDITVKAEFSNKNVQLVGDVVGSWVTGTGRRMTYNANGTNTKTVTLPKGSYEFKFFIEDFEQWRGNDGGVVNDSCSGWSVWTGGNNLTLNASGGTYTFTYNRSSSTFSISYKPITYSVSVNTSPAGGGSASASKTNVNLGDTTTLNANVNKGYTFNQWVISGEYDVISGSLTSTSITISPKSNISATARYTGFSGKVVYEAGVGGSVSNKGGNVTYPAESKSTAMPIEGYSFTGWTITGGTEGTDYTISTGSANEATIGIKIQKQDVTITAKANFSTTDNTVKIVAGEGGTVSNAGTHTLVYPASISTEATAGEGYTFKNWSITGGTEGTDYKITVGSTSSAGITIQPLTGKTITLTANFTLKTYTVTFKNFDGTVLHTQKVEHGSGATAPANPTRPDSGQYSYTFKSWDIDFSNVTSDLTVTATYTATLRDLTVTFVDHNGTTLKTETVKYGSSATAPQNPTRSDGFIFKGWDKDFSIVTEDMYVKAEYRDDNVYLMGVTGAWEQVASTKMSYGNVSTMTLTLSEGLHEFKFYYNGAWLSNNGTVNNTTDENGSSNPWETYNGNNCKLNAIGGTYTFRFNKSTQRFEIKHTPITYTVKFVYNGTVLSTQTVKRGESAVPPAAPTKEADVQYSYVFKGWDKDYTSVRSDLTINPVFEPTLNYYTVIFKDWDGTTINTQSVSYGSGATAPAAPTRAGYTFTGWDKDFSNITGILTVTAQYELNSYTVRFENWNGVEVETQTVIHGGSATAPAKNPTREPDAQYTYTFKGWDKSFSKVTSNLTVIATYTQTVNNYTVTFQNYDGKVYSTQSVPYGSAATAPKNPTRTDGWTFIGWDTDAYKNVTGDLTVTALWRDDNVYLLGVTGAWSKTESNKMSYGSISTMSLDLNAGEYEFKFIYDDTWYTNTGTVIDTTDENGSSNPWVSYEATPNAKLKASGGTYVFRFNKSNRRFEVKYMPVAHTVTFRNWDDSVIATLKVADGDTAAAVAPTAVRPATEEYTYTFTGWDKDLNTAITGNTTFKALYSQEKNKYTVTFLNWDDSVLKTDTVEYGSGATAPANPEKAGDAQYTYTFTGWDKDFSRITGATTVKALFSETVNKYTVTFLNYNGSVIDTQTVEYGESANEPAVPDRTGFTFIGWDKEFTNIVGNTTVTAQFRDNNIYLNGSFFDNWGYNKPMTNSGGVYSYSIKLDPGTYKFKLNQDSTWYGNSGTIQDTTSATSSAGWDMYTSADDCTLVASGGTYTFRFNDSTKKLVVEYDPTMYTVTFVNWDDTVLKEYKVAINKPATPPTEVPAKPSTEQYEYTFSGWDKDFSAITADTTIKAQFTESLRKYTVIFNFVAADGTATYVEQLVEYGTAAIAPELPRRQDGFAFTKWDADFSNITGDLTVNAVYTNDNLFLAGSFNGWSETSLPFKMTDDPDVFTVTLELDYDDYTFKIKRGEGNTWYGNDGTIEDTTATTSSTGWVMSTSAGDCTLAANGGWYTFIFHKSTESLEVKYVPYEYTVTFVDDNGAIIDEQTVKAGQSAVAPVLPVRPDGYELSSWDKEFDNIHSNLTVTGQYYDNNIYLKGDFNNWGTSNILNTYGNIVVSTRIEIKEAGEYAFKFFQNGTHYTDVNAGTVYDTTGASWWKTTSDDAGNTILNAKGGYYTFTFATDTKDFNVSYEPYMYTVTFLDDDGTILDVQSVAIGTSAVPPVIPERENGWAFDKWDTDFSNVQSDLTVTASYFDNNVYLVGNFNNWEKTHKLTQIGTNVVSTKIELEPGNYEFKILQRDFYTHETVQTVYDTTGADWWRTTIAGDKGNTGLVASGGIYTFSFATDTKNFQVSYEPRMFDVTFNYVAADGVTPVTETQQVAIGKDAVEPEIPRRLDGWVFTQWDNVFTNVQTDLVVNAQYINDNIYLVGDFNGWNETSMPFNLTDNEDVVTLTLELTGNSYGFKVKRGESVWLTNTGTITDTTDENDVNNPWKMSVSSQVGDNCTLKAAGGFYTFTYTKSTQMLNVDYKPYINKVVFKDYDGTVLKEEDVAIGKDATAPEDPVRTDGFIFTGWDTDFTNVQTDLTVTAQYKDDNVYLYHSSSEEWIKLGPVDSDVVSTVVRNLEAGEYEFKFLYEDVWYTNANKVVDNASNWSTTTEGANCKLQASGGSYTYTFDKVNKTFSIEQLSFLYNVTFKYYIDNGVTLKSDVIQVERGASVTPPEIPVRSDGWHFIYWKNTDGTFYFENVIENVQYDMTIEAWYFDDNVYLVGEVVDGVWSRTGENMMPVYSGTAGIGTSSMRVHLNPGSYDFKLVYRLISDYNNPQLIDNYYGNNGDINDTTKASSDVGWQMSTTAGECTLNATGGWYTFTFDRETKFLTVDYEPDVFTVNFVDHDGTVLKTEEVVIGNSATPPTVPSRDDAWYFIYWAEKQENGTPSETKFTSDATVENVTRDMTIYAWYYDDNVYLIGDVTDGVWDRTQENMMDGTGRVTTMTVELPQGSYDFKLIYRVINDWTDVRNNYWGNDGDIDDTTYKTSDIGWEMTTTAGNCTLNATGGWYKFTFNKDTHYLTVEYVPYEFEVKFVDWDGTVLSTQTVLAGEDAVAPKDPSREGTEQYTYNFTGWDTDFTNVQSDLTVNAVYEQIGNTFTVTFINYDGSVLDTQEVLYGESATTPTVPTRNDAWFFIYWAERNASGGPTGSIYMNTVDNVTRDMTIHAWFYDDNVYLAGQVVDGIWGRTQDNMMDYHYDGTSSMTVHLDPGTYEFKLIYRVVDDWSDMTNVMYGNEGRIVDTTETTSPTGWFMDTSAGNCRLQATGGTYTFIFDRNSKYLRVLYVPDVFTVTFVNWDGTVLKTEEVEITKDATAPEETPTRGGGFTFSGWDKDFTNVHSDLTVTAQYADDNLYVMGDFNNWSKDHMLTTYGDNIVSVRVPIETGVYDFKFFRNGTYYTDINAGTFTDETNGWWNSTTNGAVDDTTINATGGWYTFTFNHSTGEFKVEYEPFIYNVQFVDHNGTVLHEEKVQIGHSATAPEAPFREADAQYTYTFAGWDSDLTAEGLQSEYLDVRKDLIVHAAYDTTVNNYKVTFVYIAADSKTELTTVQEVPYGSSATAPELPRRQDGWAFKNWDKDFSNITGDLTVTAEYFDDNVYLSGEFNGWDPDSHPFKLTDDPDVVILTMEFDRDVDHEFKIRRAEDWFGNNGTIVDTTKTTSDNGWYMSTSDGNCSLDASGGTYIFIYNKKTQMLEVLYDSAYTFTVKFVDHDGTVLKEETVEIGWYSAPPADPFREADAQYTYTFAGWDSDLTTEGLQSEYNNVTRHLTVTAIYKETVNVYKVEFVDWNGTVLSTQEVAYGSAATAPADPVREPDAQYTYTFAGWDKDFDVITGETTITATYTQVINEYTVTFVDWNGTVLKTEKVAYGSGATAPADPVRTNYVFKGWDKDFSNIIEDTVVTATYADDRIYLKGDFNNWGSSDIMTPTGNPNEYSIKIKIEEGDHEFKINRQDDWFGNYGTIIDTTKTTSEDGWEMSTSADNCTLDATGGWYTFIFNTETNKLEVLYDVAVYTVVFLDNEGNLLSEQKVAYGKAAVAPVPPVKEGLVFAGWDTDFSYITTDTVVTAIYANEGDVFTVTFVDWDGTVLSEQTVLPGKSATAPADPTREGDEQYSYIFAGWDQNFEVVSEDMIITATYTQVVNKFTVTFVDYDDTILKIEEVEYGKSATAPKVLGREGFIFTGWDVDFTTVTSELVVKATYVEAGSTVTVTFVNWDGKVIETQQVAVGTAAVVPSNPVRKADAQYTYTFAGWDSDLTTEGLQKEYLDVRKDLTVYATYEKTLNKYTVRFYNYNGAFLGKQEVEYGKGADGSVYRPLRPGSNGYTYTFAGWDKDISYIISDLDVKAVFNANRVTYTVTFVSYDGKVLKTQEVPHGGAATAPAMPALPSGKSAEWDKSFNYIISDLTVNLVLTDNNVYILGDMTGWDETAMKSIGGNVYSYKVDLNQGIYEFRFQYPKDTNYSNNGTVYDSSNGWWSTGNSSGNITLQATGGNYEFQFNKVTHQMQVIYVAPEYTVTFVNYDGTVLSTQSVKRGNAAAAPADPTKPSTAQYTYTFAGWDKKFDNIVSNLTVKALYTQSLNVYYVTFVDYDGSIISSQEVEYGSSAIAPPDPVREHYTFIGWDRTDFTNVTSDMTIKAMYSSDSYKVTVDHSTGGTASTSTSSVPFGSTVTLTATPDAGYSLSGWTISGNYDIVSGNLTSPTLVIRPKSDIYAYADFGQGVSITVYSYSESGYEYLYIKESSDSASNEPLGAEPGTYQAKTTVFDVVTWRTSDEITMTNGYSAEVFAILNDTASQSGEIFLQDVLYKDGEWAGISEVWITEEGIVTTRRDLLDLIENVTPTYNGGVNADNYTDRTWNDFVDAYEYAAEVSGSKDPDQSIVDQAQADLQEAYDNLKKRSYNVIVVTQVGGIGTVTVGDTTITTAKGTAQASNGSDVTIFATAPVGYYISSIVANGSPLFINSNISLTAKSAIIEGISEDQDVEVHYESKRAYAITIDAYDENCGTIYYNGRVVDPKGEVITVFAGDNADFRAVPNDGFAVYEWSVNDEIIPLKKSFSITDINENYFVGISWQQIKQINVTITSQPTSAGKATAASGGQTASTSTGTITIKTDQFELITLTATVTDPLFEFAGWSIHGDYAEYDSTTRMDAVFNITATEDITATAMFVQVYRKIYLDNEAQWTQPYIYYWGSDRPADEWPGKKMEYDPESGYWYGYIPVDATDLQFNDGTNENFVDFSDVTPNLYNNGTKTSGIYAEKGYYLQGIWNGVEHSLEDLEKFIVKNADGSYSLTITVTSTTDGYIYVNPTNENSEFWNAEYNGKTDNPQILEFIGKDTDNPNYVKVEIDPHNLDADYEVTFTFYPEATGADKDKFMWTVKPLIPSITIIGTDGRGTNSSDANMITPNNRVGDTYFEIDDVITSTSHDVYVSAQVTAGEPVTFYTQVNGNGFGGYDYYVYGWVINGTEFVSAKNMGNGLYSGSYIFTKNNTDVVPVYFHTKEWLAANRVQQVTVYVVADKNIVNWDEYMSSYTWYNGANGLDYEQFGAYPGQLMVPVAGLDGVYYTFVETTSPDGVKVSGIRFNNYAKSDMIDTIVVDYKNIQTYDYYDFVALLEDGRTNITYVIKNTNDKYNAGRLENEDKVNLDEYNFVQYTDYSNLKTDIFGNNIESIYSTLTNDNAVYIIQAGDTPSYDTPLNGANYVKCYIYDVKGNFLGSCFSYELHDKDSKIWTEVLAKYQYQRAYFSYEAMNGNRYDGEWYGDGKIDITVNVSVNVGITSNGGQSYSVNTTAPVNKATYGAGFVNVTEQNVNVNRGSEVTLTATPERGYRFVGWYTIDGVLFSTNKSVVVTAAVGTTYTAVFEKIASGNFYVNHYLYTGVGDKNAYIPTAHGGKAQLYVGITNVTQGIAVELTQTESAFVQAKVDDVLTITIATDAIGADKFYAWYVDAYEKYGFTSFEEVGVDSVDNIYNNIGTVVGRSDMVYFRFTYVVKEDDNFNITLYSDLMPVSAEVTLVYQYADRNGVVKNYYVPYTLTNDEIEGFAGNNFKPYTPAFITGEGWVNTILAYAPFVSDLSKDTTWIINDVMYDSMTFVLCATQNDSLFTITSQVGDYVLVSKHLYSSVYEIDVRDVDDTLSQTGFWYNDVDNDGVYTKGVDLILTYGPRYAYRVTCDMNINYEETDKYDFNINIDDPAYGREQTSDADGSNKKDKVTVDYMINILTPYFYGNGNNFVPSDDITGDPNGQHVTVESLRNAGYTVTYGVILEQVGSFEPGSDKYPTFEDALNAAKGKNYGVGTDIGILTGVIENYKKPVMTSAGTYCTLYDATDYNITNKNRFRFTIGFNNTVANQKKFFNVYSYVTVTTPEGVTTTYISNVQTLNIYTTGTTDVVVK